jgi:hypothetical protein
MLKLYLGDRRLTQLHAFSRNATTGFIKIDALAADLEGRGNSPQQAAEKIHGLECDTLNLTHRGA